MANDRALVEAIRKAARPLSLDPLVEAAGGRSLVLIGEASHGTHEFYRLRAQLTRRLIEEKGFASVAIEGDWPDTWRVDRWVRGRSEEPDADAALAGFRRFPTWMWRNTDMLAFVGWLREHNRARPDAAAGVYGLDLYSLHSSIEAVLAYLERVDPEAARRARARYACFDHFGEDAQSYGMAAAGLGLDVSCEREVVAQLVELRKKAAAYASRDGHVAEDDYFQAERNALLVRNAEEYYREMFGSRVSTWNLRDTHMADTLDALLDHQRRLGRSDRTVVWAHNSHLGDARATRMGAEGEINLGQLVRERHPGASFLVGFSTHEGTVTAADEWGDPPVRMAVRPSLEGSWERAFHDTGLRELVLLLEGAGAALAEERLQRAIGVIYRPETERASHYYEVALGRQFDAVIHVDTTSALHPLEPGHVWERGVEEPAETFPFGL